MKKHEWKKDEKGLYMPKNEPQLIKVPFFGFFSVSGEGNPNDDFFAEYISVLFSLSYAVKMSAKKSYVPPGYYDYSVYPLEGVWDISETARAAYTGKLDKNTLVFDLMIRQPDFVTVEFASFIIQQLKKIKPNDLLEKVIFRRIEEGSCVQMMHSGSYDTEPASFARMEAYCLEHDYVRESFQHREIYLSDARKVAPDKLKTILRFRIKA
jgi:hypothetical protein